MTLRHRRGPSTGELRVPSAPEGRGQVGARSVAPESASVVVALSQSSSDAPLPKLARQLGTEVEPRLVAVLDFRLDHTLTSVGRRFGVTLERIRQVEQKARAQIKSLILTWAEPFAPRWTEQLELLAVSEEELFGPLRDSATDVVSQDRLGRLALMTVFPSAAHPVTFRGAVLRDWCAEDSLA